MTINVQLSQGCVSAIRTYYDYLAFKVSHFWAKKKQMESGLESLRKLPSFSQKVAYFLIEIKPFSQRTKSHLCNILKINKIQNRDLFIGFNLTNVKKLRVALIYLTFIALFVMFWVSKPSRPEKTWNSVTNPVEKAAKCHCIDYQ